MRRDVVTSVIGMIVLTVLLGLLYPLVITGVSQVAFPGNANGQKVDVAGKLVGSKIIWQSFEQQVFKNGQPVLAPDPLYFQSRPSGTVPVDNAAGTAFGNYGPNSTITEAAITGNIQ